MHAYTHTRIHAYACITCIQYMHARTHAWYKIYPYIQVCIKYRTTRAHGQKRTQTHIHTQTNIHGTSCRTCRPTGTHTHTHSIRIHKQHLFSAFCRCPCFASKSSIFSSCSVSTRLSGRMVFNRTCATSDVTRVFTIFSNCFWLIPCRPRPVLTWSERLPFPLPEPLDDGTDANACNTVIYRGSCCFLCGTTFKLLHSEHVFGMYACVRVSGLTHCLELAGHSRTCSQHFLHMHTIVIRDGAMIVGSTTVK